MSKSNKIAGAVIATLLTSSLSTYSTSIQAAELGPMEKCYGVAKMGKNDCGTPTHACAGQAAVNNDPNEWIYVPLGTCVKTPGGSLTPKKNSTSS